MEDKILKAEEADGKKLCEEFSEEDEFSEEEEFSEELENNIPQELQDFRRSIIRVCMREGQKLLLVFKAMKENRTDKHPKRIPYVIVRAQEVLPRPKIYLNHLLIDWLFNYLLTGESDESATYQKGWDRLPEKEGLDFERNMLLESLNRGGKVTFYNGNGWKKLYMNVYFPLGEICFSPYLKGNFWSEVQTVLNKQAHVEA